MNWTELLTKEMTANYNATEKMFGLLNDADLAWKPATGENWMTAGQLLHHLNHACGACCEGFVTGDWSMMEGGDEDESVSEVMLPPADKLPTVDSVADALTAFKSDRKLAFQMIEKAGEENLDCAMSAAPWSPQQQTNLGRHLLQMSQHLGTHKAQLFYYLKLMGRKVDTMTLWGV
ncbi:MAG: hypothetical protein ACI9UK_000025 [Candidatus Krumholzibacteriia bacterium]|jgi:hypothetical protein